MKIKMPGCERRRQLDETALAMGFDPDLIYCTGCGATEVCIFWTDSLNLFGLEVVVDKLEEAEGQEVVDHFYKTIEEHFAIVDGRKPVVVE